MSSKQIKALARVGISIMKETSAVVDVLWIPGTQTTAIEEILDALNPFLKVPEEYDGSYEMTVEYFEEILRRYP